MNRRNFLLLPTSLLLPACAGYELGGTKPKALAKLKTLAVPTFVNDTQEPRLEVLATNAIIKRLQMDGAYQITDREDAEAVLFGVIADVSRRPGRYVTGSSVLSQELIVTLRINFRVEERLTGVVLYRGSASGSSNVIMGGKLALAESQAQSYAVDRLAIDIASQICNGM